MNKCKPAGDFHRIRIVLADQQNILRAGLRILLGKEADLEVVGQCADLPEAFQQARETGADVVITDLRLLLATGGEALNRVRGEKGGVRTIVLADAETEKADVIRALKMGVRGVVWKDSAARILIESIGSVFQGNIWLGTEAHARLDDSLALLNRDASPPAGPEAFSLTRRELEIVSKVVSGLSNREISRKLSISEDTVKHHITNIFNKVGAYNRLELALFAFHHGLIRKKKRKQD